MSSNAHLSKEEAHTRIPPSHQRGYRTPSHAILKPSNCPDGHLERLKPIGLQQAKRADAVRRHYSSSNTPHSCLFLRRCKPTNPQALLHLHHCTASLSFRRSLSCPIVAIQRLLFCFCTNVALYVHRCQAQSPSRLPVLITAALRHNNLFSSPLATSKHNTLSSLATLHFFSRTTTHSFQRRPLTDNSNQQLERHH